MPRGPKATRGAAAVLDLGEQAAIFLSCLEEEVRKEGGGDDDLLQAPRFDAVMLPGLLTACFFSGVCVGTGAKGCSQNAEESSQK